MAFRITIDRETQSWLDFVQGLKGYSYRDNTNALREIFARKKADYEASTGETVDSWTKVGPLLEDEPAYQFYGLAMTHTQHMMWDGVLKVVEANRESIDAERSRTIAQPRGSLRLRDDLPLPHYYAVTDYHLRPGGMYRGADQGFYTSISNVIYFAGENDSVATQRWAVSTLPELPDGGRGARILDMGCGIGQSTWPLAERFPNAEIHGCDLSAPLLEHAHRIAEDKGLAIHYAQQDAANTDYDSSSFDLVFSFIMFHEISNAAAKDVIAEAFRLLRPGGHFAFCDIRPYEKVGPFQAFLSDWQTRNNGENFWRGHCLRDYHQLLTAAGFQPDIQEHFGKSPTNMVYVARKP